MRTIGSAASVTPIKMCTRSSHFSGLAHVERVYSFLIGGKIMGVDATLGTFSANEATCVTGVPLQQVHRIIVDAGEEARLFGGFAARGVVVG